MKSIRRRYLFTSALHTVHREVLFLAPHNSTTHCKRIFKWKTPSPPKTKWNPTISFSFRACRARSFFSSSLVSSYFFFIKWFRSSAFFFVCRIWSAGSVPFIRFTTGAVKFMMRKIMRARLLLLRRRWLSCFHSPNETETTTKNVQK